MINHFPENHLFNQICRDFLSFSNGNGGWLREKKLWWESAETLVQYEHYSET